MTRRRNAQVFKYAKFELTCQEKNFTQLPQRGNISPSRVQRKIRLNPPIMYPRVTRPELRTRVDSVFLQSYLIKDSIHNSR